MKRSKIVYSPWRRAAAVLIALLAAASLSSSQAQAACKLEKIAELPVTMSGQRALVPAKINGADVMFMADSGAFFSTISPGNAAALNLSLSALPNLMVGGVGGRVSVQLAVVKTLGLAGATLHNVDFIVGGSEVGSQTIGLLGQNVLHFADVEYDLGGSAIRLMSSRDCGNMNLAYWAHDKPTSVASIEWSDRTHPHTVATVLVNGTRVRAILDTGAASSVLSLRAARRAGIKLDDAKVERAGLSSGIGSSLVQAWRAPIATFEFGDEAIKNTALTVEDLDDTGTDMLLGADFFLSHRVFVSNSKRRVYFTYEGGPVFKLPAALVTAEAGSPGGSAAMVKDAQASQPQHGEAAASENPEGAPTDADGFARRGDYFASRRQYDKAAADLVRARKLEPQSAQYAFRLAAVRIAADQRALAKPDLDDAIRLKPDDAAALIVRAQQRRLDHDATGERADLDAASHALAKPADLRFTLARMYGDADWYDQAISEYDMWIDAHPDDSRRSIALNGRCWTRALADRELDKALSDCNRAIWIMREPSFFDSRGFVRLRRGEFSRAIADYDDALKRNPKITWSLYGRGLAELKTGDADKGRNDIAAATAIDPKLPERAAKLGLSPDVFAAPSSTAVASSTH